MSYCVNCGVELDASQKACPLCGTPVVNPAAPYAADAPRPYPKRLERVMSHVDRKYGAALCTLFLAIPVLVTALLDLLTNHAFTWSVFVIGAALCVAVFAFVPLYFGGKRAVLYLSLDALVTLLYLLLIDLGSGEAGVNWFLQLGLPITVIAYLLSVGGYLCWSSPRSGLFSKMGINLLMIGLACMALECFLIARQNVGFHLYWSIFVLIPCAVVAVGCFLISKKHKLKDEIKRRLFL